MSEIQLVNQTNTVLLSTTDNQIDLSASTRTINIEQVGRSAESKQVLTIVSSGAPVINTDLYDAVSITALAEDIEFTTNLSGAPQNAQRLLIRIKDDGTVRSITWGTKFVAQGVALPTLTVQSKVMTVGFIYDSIIEKWGCIARIVEQ